MTKPIRSACFALILIASWCLSTGCEPPAAQSNTEATAKRDASPPPPPPSFAPPATTPTASQAAAAADSDAGYLVPGGVARDSSAAPAAPQPAPTASPRSEERSENAPRIRLSAATALPQSLPTGTAMGFSVDYGFASGRPNPSSKYFWVLQSAQGGAVELPVELKRRGNLMQFIPQWQPQHGGFACFIVEQTQYGERRAISDKQELR